MPNQVNQSRCHPFPKARYQVKNWGEYDQALQQRGSLTVWVTPEAIAAWQAARTGRRGRSRCLFASGDRDRASSTLGVWSTVAANGRPVALPRDLTWAEPSGS